MEHINILNLKPSDVRWLEDHLVFESYQHDFFQKLYRFLIHDTEDIATLDTIYCTGVQLRKAYVLLQKHHRDELDAINNMASRSFLDGVQGFEFNPG
jgi:hypothetical protein